MTVQDHQPVSRYQYAYLFVVTGLVDSASKAGPPQIDGPLIAVITTSSETTVEVTESRLAALDKAGSAGWFAGEETYTARGYAGTFLHNQVKQIPSVVAAGESFRYFMRRAV
ncbi:hypothetical protein ACFFX1_55030 [Dactylosporangium sucinum]|uniref:Uncharacterized protein n=1 Tax=Dactylosporangium sucinum TaxID=1424081 RepID=A0A917X1K2_9ACTN|nr:hypothetical protein [Dactylosporangium sucinum]GGM53162.1 hypothetical protein GCM10007977_063540 [Dactylosporangium sucinum]